MSVPAGRAPQESHLTSLSHLCRVPPEEPWGGGELSLWGHAVQYGLLRWQKCSRGVLSRAVASGHVGPLPCKVIKMKRNEMKQNIQFLRHTTRMWPLATELGGTTQRSPSSEGSGPVLGAATLDVG